MIAPHFIKTIGYLISIISVLATVSWDSASRNPLLMAALIGGVATFILGMVLRWLSYVLEQHRGG